MSSFLERVKKGEGPAPSKFGEKKETEEGINYLLFNIQNLKKNWLKKLRINLLSTLTFLFNRLPPPFPPSKMGSDIGAVGSAMPPPAPSLSDKPSLFGSIPKTGPSPFTPLEWTEFFDSRELISDVILNLIMEK